MGGGGEFGCNYGPGFLYREIESRDMNQTNLVFIPKVEVAETVGQFRPISLCNFCYKIISKILANRMKCVMPKLISEQQRAFVPGRHIQDNIFIVHEAFHYLEREKKRREVATKIDMNKAYDRVEWDFLEALLRQLGFTDRWVTLVMTCI